MSAGAAIALPAGPGRESRWNRQAWRAARADRDVRRSRDDACGPARGRLRPARLTQPGIATSAGARDTGPPGTAGGDQAIATGPQTPPTPQPGRAPSLRLRLLALVMVLVGALGALAALGIWQAHDAARARTADQMLGTVRAMALLADQEFARAEALLQGVAADPRVAAGDLQAFLQAAARLDRALDGLVMAMAEAPGRQHANTLRGVLAEPTPMPGGLDAVFETRSTVISNLYRGSVSGQPVVAIAVPVPPAEGRAPRWAIGLTLNRARLAAALMRPHLPAGAVGVVLDREGRIAARTARDAELVGTPATEELMRAIGDRQAGIVERIVNLDGVASVVAFARAPLSGYVVGLALPEAVFARERNAMLARLGYGVLPLALAALLVASLLGLRLRAALAALSDPRPGAPRIREVEELAQALRAADAARAASEAALRERTAWLEATQQAAALGTWDLALPAMQVSWSEAMWRLYGLDPARDGPASVAMFRSRVLPEDLPAVDAAWTEAERSGLYQAEFRIRRPDGAIRWMRSQGRLRRDAAGQPARLLGANIDVTERRRLEAEREALLAEKDLLLRETHHRVKNSLQLVLGLLLLQARGAEPETAERLKEAAGRIVSIAAVHRRLYESGAGAAQDAAQHLALLVEELGRSVGSGPREVALRAEPGLLLEPERLAALGLLVTELVTNALKHGAGRVTVSLALAEEEAVLAVADEGPGFPLGFDPAVSTGLGMRVAGAMARQLRGLLAVRPGPGGAAEARFPRA